MNVINLEKDQLEYIKELTEKHEKEFPYPIYFEYDKNGYCLIKIKYGNYIDYYTHARVLISEDIKIKNLKMLQRFKKSDLYDGSLKSLEAESIRDFEYFINILLTNKNLK